MAGSGRCRPAARPCRNRTSAEAIGCCHARGRCRSRASWPRRGHRLSGHRGAVDRPAPDQCPRSAATNRLRGSTGTPAFQKEVEGAGGRKLRSSPRSCEPERRTSPAHLDQPSWAARHGRPIGVDARPPTSPWTCPSSGADGPPRRCEPTSRTGMVRTGVSVTRALFRRRRRIRRSVRRRAGSRGESRSRLPVAVYGRRGSR